MINILFFNRNIIAYILTIIGFFIFSSFQLEGNYAYINSSESSNTETKIIKKGNAEIVYADIKLIAGNVEINGGCNDLMKGIFIYENSDYKPKVNYDESPEIGNLNIELSRADFDINIDDDDCDDVDVDWKIELNDEVPLDLEIQIGAGEANLNLGSLNLENLEVKVGAGEYQINLKNSSVSRFKFIAGAGEATIDLTGERHKNLDAEFTCGFGELTVILPKDIGAKVEAVGLAGSISYKGFYKDGNEYVNEKYRNTLHHIDLKITGAIGEINLKLEE